MKALTPVIGADWNIARHMLDGLERTKVLQITEKQRVAVLAAALLHDIAPGAPSIVLKAFSGENISLQDYLSLDDSTITEFFKSCTKSSDIILSQLGDGILNRNLYKGIDLTGVPGNELAHYMGHNDEVYIQSGLVHQVYQSSQSTGLFLRCAVFYLIFAIRPKYIGEYLKLSLIDEMITNRGSTVIAKKSLIKTLIPPYNGKLIPYSISLWSSVVKSISEEKQNPVPQNNEKFLILKLKPFEKPISYEHLLTVLLH